MDDRWWKSPELRTEGLEVFDLGGHKTQSVAVRLTLGRLKVASDESGCVILTMRVDLSGEKIAIMCLLVVEKEEGGRKRRRRSATRGSNRANHGALTF